MTLHRIACVVFIVVCGCTGPTDDELATDEAAVTDPVTGKPVCGGKKVLVCHIPPGNPANAHEICVGEPAVAAHVKNHSDPVGPCPSSDAGAPTPPEGDTGAPPSDGDIIR